jgi:hypothetical protein
MRERLDKVISNEVRQSCDNATMGENSVHRAPNKPRRPINLPERAHNFGLSSSSNRAAMGSQTHEFTSI